MSVSSRFWAKVDKSSECWEWTGAIQSGGYGNFNNLGSYVLAHRYAYEDARGKIPGGLVLDHLCRNRKCVRPDHLEAVSQRINLLRGETAPARHVVKTHCPAGHPYNEENTIHKNGARFCRKCRNERSKRNYRRRREAIGCAD